MSSLQLPPLPVPRIYIEQGSATGKIMHRRHFCESFLLGNSRILVIGADGPRLKKMLEIAQSSLRLNFLETNGLESWVHDDAIFGLVGDATQG